MNIFCVYKHTSPNGKTYIGITSRDPEKRWKRGLGYKKNQYFYNAIQKYGWDSFSHDILYAGLTKEQACEKEVELISYYKSDQRMYGYNIESGGIYNTVSKETIQKLRESHKGKKLPEEQKRKIKARLKGRPNKYKGIPLSEEHRRKISEGNKGRIVSQETREKIKARNTGKTMSAESRAKMSESHKGLKPSKETVAKWKRSNQSMMTPVERLDKTTNKIVYYFDSTMDAYRFTGVCSSSIVKCCRGKRKTAGGFKWRYAIETKAS